MRETELFGPTYLIFGHQQGENLFKGKILFGQNNKTIMNCLITFQAPCVV